MACGQSKQMQIQKQQHNKTQRFESRKRVLLALELLRKIVRMRDLRHGL